VHIVETRTTDGRGTPARGLRSGDVHVWAVPLHGVTEPPLLSLISPTERDRMERLVFADDRRRYAGAHAAMRTILGEYLGRRPESLRLEPDQLGKPHLAGSDLQCSLSHAGELALVAIGRRWPLGVDVEQARPLPDADALKAACFTERERKHLDRAGESELLRLWTRKEALLKATGEGLRTAPREVEVLAPEPRPGWGVVDLAPAAGYIGAAAVRKQTSRVVVTSFSWPAT
jgi:4'-phosphopantetheinyl transferase